MNKIITTLCYVVVGDKVLLGYKKKGFGDGKWNGFGGKINAAEDKLEAASRELFEESGLRAKQLEYMGLLDFVFPHQPQDNHLVYIFRCQKFTGDLKETEEMKPQWFSLSKIPYDKTWDDDQYWLPLLLAGKKFKGRFVFDEKNLVKEKDLQIVANLSF